MEIRNFLHKGLRRLYEKDDAKGLPPASVDKIRKMIGFLEAMKDASELHKVPIWKAHTLTGRTNVTWSLHVTRKLASDFLDQPRRLRNLRSEF